MKLSTKRLHNESVDFWHGLLYSRDTFGYFRDHDYYVLVLGCY